MSTFVIVHGAWMGSASWTPLADVLRGRGHYVFVPSLTGLGERRHLFGGDVTLSTHIADVVGTIETEALDQVVLVGHSYGGMVITGVADRLAGRISHIAYLDAFLPADGQSLFDCVPPEQVMKQVGEAGAHSGVGVPPLPRDPSSIPDAYRFYLTGRSLQPLGTFVEKLTFTAGGYDRVGRRLYVMCKPPSPFGQFFERLQTDPAWRTETLPCGHLLHLEMTDRVADLLADFAAR